MAKEYKVIDEKGIVFRTEPLGRRGLIAKGTILKEADIEKETYFSKEALDLMIKRGRIEDLNKKISKNNKKLDNKDEK